MIGIIGAGNMGRSIAIRLTQKVLISDVDRLGLRLPKNKNIIAAQSNIELTKRSKTIILAVKPQDIMEVLEEIRLYAKTKLIISIAAGIRTCLIEKILPDARIIRVMPNMPAVVGKGISCIAKGRLARKEDLDIARKIFLKIGDVVDVKEGLMDAVTSLSGSGPAYYFFFTDLLEKAGRSVGLNKALSTKLAKATFIGTALSVSSIDIPMQDFVKKVASKGGTTEAALKVFKQKGLGHIVKQALKAAKARSKHLTNVIKCAMQ